MLTRFLQNILMFDSDLTTLLKDFSSLVNGHVGANDRELGNAT